MSGEATLWAARQDISNHAAKLTLIALCDAFDDRTGRCFPSHEHICDFVRRGETQIKEAIRWLEAEGWIKRGARFSDNGRRKSNNYEIVFDRGESFKSMLERRRKMKGNNDEGGKSGTGGKAPEEGSENRPSKGAESSPPLTESLLNNSAQAREGDKSAFVGKVDWWHRLHLYRLRATWPLTWGPFMGKPGSPVPQHLVELWRETKGEAFKNEGDNPATKKPAKKRWIPRGNGESVSQRPGTSHD